MQPVEITAREIYDKLTGLYTQMAVMNEKFDRVIPRLDDHENRLRHLEERRWPLKVVAAVVGSVGALVGVAGLALLLLL